LTQNQRTKRKEKKKAETEKKKEKKKEKKTGKWQEAGDQKQKTREELLLCFFKKFGGLHIFRPQSETSQQSKRPKTEKIYS